MKKIFISQPMNGLTNDEIKTKRKEMIKKLEIFMRGEQFEVIDSFFETIEEPANPLWYLGKSIELLSFADYVIFAHEWDEARGCRIEHMVAQEYGIPPIYEDCI